MGGAMSNIEINTLDSYSFNDVAHIPDGYDLKPIPDLTRDNFNTLIEEHNKLVKIIYILSKKIGVFINEDD